ncbi:MAG: metalloregulator ArsR/SmtB family transcription factor [bacterium]|nr:metalloregulator ArsR/SmtB family transcription factor [bacterium]
MSPNPTILDHAAILSEITRCRVLRLLERHELTVSELVSVLQLPQSTASRHLKVLADAGWVQSRRDGTSSLYQLAASSLDESAARLWELIRDQLAESDVSRQDQRRLESVLRRRRSRSQTFFTETASEWDRLRDELFGRRFDLQALLALLDRRWVVGDLGCGTGRTSEALAPHVTRVWAVDGSDAMLEAARERLEGAGNVTFRRGDLEELPLEDATLDAAVLFLALHHTTEPERVLSEARRVMKPGARLLIVDMLPHDREDYRQRMGHVWLGFPRRTIVNALADHGFEDTTFQSLPADPEAQGPMLFVATATAPEAIALSAVDAVAARA